MKRSLLVLFFISLNAFAQVGINTTTPKATLDVNGNMIVRDVKTLKSNKTVPLYIDENGLVGKVNDEISSKQAYYSSRSSSFFSHTEFNKGNTNITVPISSSDAFVNSLNTTVNNNSVVIQEDGIYSIAGSTNYLLGMNNDDGGVGLAYVVTNIQVSRDNGATYSSVAGGRTMFPRAGTTSGRYYSYTIPLVVLQLNAGARIRIILYRSVVGASNPEPQGVSLNQLAIANNFGANGYTLSIIKL